MELAHLTIEPEVGQKIEALFNPNKLVLAKSVNWEEQKAKERDVPELQFKNGQPRSLSIDLIFDTYDTPNQRKESVGKSKDGALKLALVKKKKHSPRVCHLFWGKKKKFFLRGVLKKLAQDSTFFMPDGTRVRATCR